MSSPGLADRRNADPRLCRNCSLGRAGNRSGRHGRGLMTAPQACGVSAIEIRADDPHMAAAVQGAPCWKAGGMEDRHYRIVAAPAPAANVSVSTAPDGTVEALFSSDFPLSKVGRRLVARTLERDAALACVRRLRSQPVKSHSPPRRVS